MDELAWNVQSDVWATRHQAMDAVLTVALDLLQEDRSTACNLISNMCYQDDQQLGGSCSNVSLVFVPLL